MDIGRQTVVFENYEEFCKENTGIEVNGFELMTASRSKDGKITAYYKAVKKPQKESTE